MYYLYLIQEPSLFVGQNVESGEEEQETLVGKTTQLMKSTIYLLTDMERFQPKRKKAKVQRRHFRLLGVKSTTPEELFSRKVKIISTRNKYIIKLSNCQLLRQDNYAMFAYQWDKSEFPFGSHSYSCR